MHLRDRFTKRGRDRLERFKIFFPITGANKRRDRAKPLSRGFIRGCQISGWSRISSAQCGRQTGQFLVTLEILFWLKGSAGVYLRSSLPIGSFLKSSIKTALHFLPAISSQTPAQRHPRGEF